MSDEIDNRHAGTRKVAARLALAAAATACLILAAAAFAAEGDVGFVKCLKDTGSGSSCSDEGGSVHGLGGATAVSTSPDGRSVYVASAGDDAVAVFARNPTTGAPNFIQVQKDGVGGIDGLEGASARQRLPGRQERLRRFLHR